MLSECTTVNCNSQNTCIWAFTLPELLEISLDIFEACRSGKASDEDLLCAHHHLWISLAWNCDLGLDYLSVQLMYREA